MPKSAQRAAVHKIRILAILGNSEGIDVQRDRALLEQLPGAETVFLVEPQRAELTQWLWDDQGWDVLFFAGHSSSQADGTMGEIAINQTDSLTIAQLKNALKAAIQQGLKLAIFNSCDGLGLARALTDLQLPQLVVMREPVPDRIAQVFLTFFLSAFSKGQSFYQAVRQAREKLQGLEDQFPCASWLPVICQNPAEKPPTWQELQEGELDRQTVAQPVKRNLRTVLLASVAVLGLVAGVRQVGWLQPWELEAYDHLMQQRPSEAPDSRLLVITIPPEDIKSQPEKQGTLSNRALAEVLEKLEPYKPALVGVDVFREHPVESQFASLTNHLRQDDRLITICLDGETEQQPDIPPAAEIPQADNNLRTRVGFSNGVFDEPDGTVRRQLLRQAPSAQTDCRVDMSFSYLIALRYLFEHGIESQNTATGIQLGKTLLRKLPANAGSYQRGDVGGDQIMLNYRAGATVAPQLTLGQVLNGNGLSRELVEGKIVLIGSTDESYGDFHLVPQSRRISERQAGVLIQAHAVSQIISAVLDGRPLIWWLPEWGEILWMGAWALVGGALAWRFRSIAWLGLFTGGAIVLLYGSCYALLAFTAGWLPLVPAALAGVATAAAVFVYFKVEQSPVNQNHQSHQSQKS